jgi:hypothetical protein
MSLSLKRHAHNSMGHALKKLLRRAQRRERDGSNRLVLQIIENLHENRIGLSRVNLRNGTDQHEQQVHQGSPHADSA